MAIGNPIPPGSKYVSHTTGWSGTDADDRTNQFDVSIAMTGLDGTDHIWHAWYRPGFGWQGYEDLLHLESRG